MLFYACSPYVSKQVYAYSICYSQYICIGYMHVIMYSLLICMQLRVYVYMYCPYEYNYVWAIIYVCKYV